MMPHQEDIARWLVTQSVGAFGGGTTWSIHVNVEPLQPDRVITLYGTAGQGPDTDELDLLRVAFQVRTRSAPLGFEGGDVYQEAHEKQETIRDLLILPKTPLVTAASTFYAVFMTSDIMPIARDETNRHIIVANYSAIRQRS